MATSTVGSIPRAIPTCNPSLKEPHHCIPTVELLRVVPRIANFNSTGLPNGSVIRPTPLPTASPYAGRYEGQTIVIKESVNNNAGVATDGDARGDSGSRYGTPGRGSGCALSVPNSTQIAGANGCEEIGNGASAQPTQSLKMATKTVSGKIRETGDKGAKPEEEVKAKGEKIVNLGLVVALLGVLSIVV